MPIYIARIGFYNLGNASEALLTNRVSNSIRRNGRLPARPAIALIALATCFEHSRPSTRSCRLSGDDRAAHLGDHDAAVAVGGDARTAASASARPEPQRPASPNPLSGAARRPDGPGAMSLHISKLRGITDPVRGKLKRRGITYTHQLVEAAARAADRRALAASSGIEVATLERLRLPRRSRTDQGDRRDLRRPAGAARGRPGRAAGAPGAARAPRGAGRAQRGRAPRPARADAGGGRGAGSPRRAPCRR